MQQIGPGHPAVRQLLALQRGSGPADRLTVAEGIWAAEAVLAASVRVPLFLSCPTAMRGPEAVELADRMSKRAEQSFEIAPKLLQRLADKDRPDGLISIVELPTWPVESFQFGPKALVLVADGIEQPGNLGTLLRTLDACAADALVLTDVRTRPENVKVFRASHGTVLRVPIVSFDDTAAAQAWLAESGFATYLADTDSASRYTEIRFADRTAIVLGNERYGITPPWYSASATRIFLPMLGVADSLNVSVSAAVLAYEARSQLSGWR